MSHPRTLHVGAGVVTRYRNGVCTFACNHSNCRAYRQPRGWRAALRLARQHHADHAAAEARYLGTPWGIPTHELPPTRRARPLRRLAIAVVVLALTALALPALLGPLTGHATPAPPAPSTSVVSTTAAGPAPEGYVPTPAGPPATDSGGQWIPKPDPAPAAPASSAAGGGR
jgi:hypothetical protein